MRKFYPFLLSLFFISCHSTRFEYVGSKEAPTTLVDVFVDEKSVNLLREAENYRWALDQFKNPTDEPEDKNNHALDALRYALTTRLQKPTGLRVI